MTSRNYVEIANGYIEAVLSGERPACHLVRQACLRQRRDLARAARGDLPYRFDEDEAARICRFIELLPHTKGELARQRIRLEPWQVFVLTTVFGWRTLDGSARRYRRAYIEVPRGNGKSALSSGVALYCLLADRELGAEVYSFATTREQAKIVFNDAKVMAEYSPQLRESFGLEVLAHSLYVKKTNSTFTAKSADGGTLDGLNTHLAVIDELHAHRTREVYDVVETSLGKRNSSLLWCITTAGFDETGICYEVRSMACKVLDGSVEDETQFAVIFSLDEGDEWDTEEALIKANPNWGISVKPSFLLPLLEKAKALPSAVNNFKTKHLDVWCNAASAWMDMGAWKLCERPELTLADFYGRECVIGLDLATASDIAAKVYLFREDDHYIAFFKFYLPEAAVRKSKNSQYEGWVREGYITTTPAIVTDLSLIEEELREDLSLFTVKAIGYDPWSATQLALNLSNDGAPMVQVRATVQNFSAPMKLVEAYVREGALLNDGNPVAAWMASNVVAFLDRKDNIFPRKERPENKIDGIVALIMAFSLIGQEEQTFKDYEDDVIDPFSSFNWD